MPLQKYDPRALGVVLGVLFFEMMDRPFAWKMEPKGPVFQKTFQCWNIARSTSKSLHPEMNQHRQCSTCFFLGWASPILSHKHCIYKFPFSSDHHALGISSFHHHNQPKQRTIVRKISKNYHRFTLFHPSEMVNFFMTPHFLPGSLGDCVNLEFPPTSHHVSLLVLLLAPRTAAAAPLPSILEL